MAATVASSSGSPPPCSRILAATSPGDNSLPSPKRPRVLSPSTPSLSMISTSPRRRDSRCTVSRPSVMDRPGGGVAVPIFSVPSLCSR